MRRGRRFTDTGEAASGKASAISAELIPTDLDAEVQWLSRVAWAFRRSPMIPVLLERLRAEEG
jgi:hypothetical protein